MNKREEIKRIYRESFSDSPEYVEMYFNNVYNDNEGMLLCNDDGQPVSALMLRQFEMSFHGSRVPVSYIAGAATKRKQRGKGYMSRLMLDALRESARRGDMMCSLIPANEALYYYYAAFGFTTVFYVKEQRFTAFHQFPVEGEYHCVDEVLGDECREAFNRFQNQRECYILHSKRDYFNIIEDLRSDGGDMAVIAVDDEDCGRRIVSMAWAVVKDGTLLVTDLMGDSRDARTAALRRLRARQADRPVLLFGHPTDSMGGRLIPRGMGRIVNVEKCLETIAVAYPRLKCTLRVTDGLLGEADSGIFHVADGKVTRLDTVPDRLDFDVTVDVFTSMVFSSPRIGDIFNFPAVRPMLSLMLD